MINSLTRSLQTILLHIKNYHVTATGLKSVAIPIPIASANLPVPINTMTKARISSPALKFLYSPPLS